ncbi:MAG: hypothetical protein ACRD20_20395 [Terriglobales bacterium]
MSRPTKKPGRIQLRTPQGSVIQADVWTQGGELRIAVDGFLDFVLILDPASARRACKRIVELLDGVD